MENFYMKLAKDRSKRNFDMVFDVIERNAWAIVISSTKKERELNFDKLSEILNALHDDIDNMIDDLYQSNKAQKRREQCL